MLVFGENWFEAGVYARYLTPWLFFTFLASPISSIFATMERQELPLIFSALMLIGRIAVLLLGGLYWQDPALTINIFGAIGGMFWMVWLFVITHLIGIETRTILYLLVSRLLPVLMVFGGLRAIL